MECVYSLLVGALKVFNDFSWSTEKVEFTYDYKAIRFKELMNKYKIHEVAGNGSELEKAINLLQWCSKNVLHNGGTPYMLG
jgi:hypothetical protein